MRDDHRLSSETPLENAMGIDIGATLCKIALDEGDGTLRYFSFSSVSVAQITAFVTQIAPSRLGITGGGASTLANSLSRACLQVNEFVAWHAGSSLLVLNQYESTEAERKYLLVSIGSGTLILLIDGTVAQRAGTVGIGGGTLMGLSSALTGIDGYDEVCRLAQDGDRKHVDLLVGDVYPDGGFDVPGIVTAVSFGKLARQSSMDGRYHHTTADSIAALTRMIGETIAQICAALAQKHSTRRIVFGGSTLRSNLALRNALTTGLLYHGCRAEYIDNGQYVGAVGAMIKARKLDESILS